MNPPPPIFSRGLLLQEASPSPTVTPVVEACRPQWAEILERCGYPTHIVLLDFETFFDRDYSLKKMSTVEYVTDKRFEELGVAIIENSGDYPVDRPESVFETNTHYAIGGLKARFGDRLEGCTVVAQNAAYDGLILVKHHGIMPKYCIDTLGLARHVNARAKNDLASLARRYGLKAKGDTNEFMHLSHKSRVRKQKKAPPVLVPPMDLKQWEALKTYACGDADIEWDLFVRLLPMLSRPEFELRLMQHTLELFWEPTLGVDFEFAEKLAADMDKEIDRAAAEVNATRKQLSGNITFVNLLGDTLKGTGESVPMKQGKKGLIPALAKNDIGTYNLLRHSNSRVVKLMEARAAVKSWPLHIRRIKRITGQARAAGGFLPVPLKYCGAHTGRFSGGEKINLQNLSSRGKNDLVNQIRGLIIAPPGWCLPICDASQVEARGTAWIAGQEDMCQAFRDFDAGVGEDIYCMYAGRMAGRKLRKPKKSDPPSVAKYLKVMRDMGKIQVLGCLAAGTPILTDRGWTAIQNVRTTDLIWDGTSWQLHGGVVHRGKKPCVRIAGVYMTPTHEVLGRDGWFPAIRRDTNSPLLATSLETSPYDRLILDREAGLSASNACAAVVGRFIHTETTWSPGSLEVVMSVLKRHLRLPTLCTASFLSPIVHDCLIEFLRSLVDARHDPTNDTALEEFASIQSGSKTEGLFLHTLSHCRGGTSLTWRSTGSTTTGDTNRETFDSFLTNSTVQTLKNVYDIVLAGPNRRYQAGPLIVANCGYGMGAAKCMDFAKSSYGVSLTLGDADKLVKSYRQSVPKITGFWREIERAFKYTVRYGRECSLPRGLRFLKDGDTTCIVLPSGRMLRYKGAKIHGSGYEEQLWMPDPEKRGSEIYMWGGYLTENVVQAMCRDLLTEALFMCEHMGWHVALHIHDELVCVAPEDQGEACLADMVKALTTTPPWADGFPLGAEGRVCKKYGK